MASQYGKDLDVFGYLQGVASDMNGNDWLSSRGSRGTPSRERTVSRGMELPLINHSKSTPVLGNNKNNDHHLYANTSSSLPPLSPTNGTYF